MKFIKKLRHCKETAAQDFVWLYEEFYFEGKFKKNFTTVFFRGSWQGKMGEIS